MGTRVTLAPFAAIGPWVGTYRGDLGSGVAGELGARLYVRIVGKVRGMVGSGLQYTGSDRTTHVVLAAGLSMGF